MIFTYQKQVVQALVASEYIFRGLLGFFVFSYVFWAAESEFRGYQAETLFNYLLLTFLINNIKKCNFRFKKNTKLFSVTF